MGRGTARTVPYTAGWLGVWSYTRRQIDDRPKPNLALLLLSSAVLLLALDLLLHHHPLSVESCMKRVSTTATAAAPHRPS